MPIYEYRCEACDHPFEVLVRSDRQEVACPRCSSKQLRKLFSVFGLNLGASSPPGTGCGCGAGGCGCCGPR